MIIGLVCHWCVWSIGQSGGPSVGPSVSLPVSRSTFWLVGRSAFRSVGLLDGLLVGLLAGRWSVTLFVVLPFGRSIKPNLSDPDYKIDRPNR